MNNLWEQQEKTREQLTHFIQSLADIWKDKPLKVVFVSQGKNVLHIIPDNWCIVTHADQIRALSEADVFITHGGSNSFHEALVQKVPMIVIPFFGDQPLVAKHTQELGIGIDLGEDDNIDTRKSKDFLEHMAQRVDIAVMQILSSDRYTQNYRTLDLDCVRIGDLLEGKIPFAEGDLLYGTNVARTRYVHDNKVHEEFRISGFRPFMELAKETSSLPRIVDIYHDVVRDDEFYSRDEQSGLEPYVTHLKEYKSYLNGETDLCSMCIKGIDFFTRFYRIHFIIDDYDPKKNYITTKEIAYVLEHRDRLQSKVFFYKNVNGRWMPVSYAAVENLIQV